MDHERNELDALIISGRRMFPSVEVEARMLAALLRIEDLLAAQSVTPPAPEPAPEPTPEDALRARQAELGAALTARRGRTAKGA